MASRRAAEELIRRGRVTVNGAVVRELGVRADAAHDVIAVDGARLPPPGPRRTVVVHKPRGIVSTLDDHPRLVLRGRSSAGSTRSGGST